MRISGLILILVIAFFAFPLFNGTPFPTSFDPSELGGFLSNVWGYWQTLVSNAVN